MEVERAYTSFATLVEPTKETASIPGWSQMASTISLSPFTIFNTPSGSPASLSNSANRIQLNGTISDGFKIMQLPSAMAFGIVQFGTMFGKLKGAMHATTPKGKCSTLHSTPLLTSNNSPEIN